MQEAVAPPKVYFKTNVTSGYVPFPVMFTDLSQNATTRVWDFNNDSIVDSTEKNPVYVYTVPGTYTVNLTVSNTKGVASKQTNVIASPAQCVDGQLILTESRITTNESMQANPDIYGDKIVWMDWRSGLDIYTYNLSTFKETQVMSYLDSTKGDPHIYRDKVVYIDMRSGRNIYMYDLSTSKETRITTNNSDQYGPDIYGDKIVWEDYRNGNCDIYMYNLSTSTETQITNNKSSQQPAIYGDRIVWQDTRNGESWDKHGNLISYWNIYMYNLSTYTETQITTSGLAQHPDIYGDRIVWMDKRNGNWDIYMYDLSTSKETQITNNELIQRYPSIFGNRIVWESYHEDNEAEVIEPDNYNIYMFDISRFKETKITTVESYKASPAIYDDKIVWTDYRNENPDIYMCTISERELESKLPAANFTVNQTGGCSPLTVLFTDTSKNSTSRSWDVNSDGIEDSDKSSFVYVYGSAGTYAAKLTAINANGTDTKTAQIIVDRKSSGGTGGGGGGSVSPEPTKNIEVKELCKVFITNGNPIKFDFTNNATCVVSVSFDAKKTVGKTTTIVEQLKKQIHAYL
uniref:PKD domain-containing protein n=1 Tax=Methanosarcina barkeri TaxID=2208 RepID=UPI0006CF517C